MFNVATQVVAKMEKKGWGCISDINGANDEKGQAAQTSYSAASPGCDTGRRGLLWCEIELRHHLLADMRQNSP